jgi:DMSO/TMAO reductase YedYZ heme-binding membrane subunit
MSNESTQQDLPRHRLWQPVTAKWFAIVFGVSLTYAIVRYHLAGDVPWSHFPLFIVNKATSLAATIFVASSYLIGKLIRWHNHDPRTKLVVIKFCGLMGFSLAMIHAFASFTLLTPAYFAKYFAADGRLNLQGEIAVLAGLIALWALALPAITTLPMMAQAIGGIRWKRSQRMGYVSLIFLLVHLIALGMLGWIAPYEWQWWLPPISLWAAAIAAVPLILKLSSLSFHRKDISS